MDETSDLQQALDALTQEKDSLMKERADALAALEAAKERAEKAEQARAEEAGDIGALKEQLARRHKEELAAVRHALDVEKKQVLKLALDRALSDALDDAGIAPDLKDAAAALIRTSQEVAIDDGQAQIAGRDVKSFISDWASGDGRAFILPPNHRGGGAIGGRARSFGGLNPFAKESRNLTEQAKLMRENPALASRLKAETIS